MTTRECHHDTTTSHADAQVICDRCEAVVGELLVERVELTADIGPFLEQLRKAVKESLNPHCPNYKPGGRI